MTACTGTPQQCRGPVPFPTTTLPKFNGTDCGPYGGGFNPACLAPPVTVVTIPSTSPPHAPSTPLPFTGGDVVALSLLGVTLLAAGLSLRFMAWRARKDA